VLAARRIYGGRWSTTLARAMAIALVYGPCLLVGFALVAIWSYLA